MVYEIKRDAEWNRMTLKFAGEVPVEVRDGLKEIGFRWEWYEHAWVALNEHSDEEIAEVINSRAASAKPRHEMTKEEEKALRAEYMERVLAGENADRWRKYYEGEIGGLVKLTDGSIVLIEKPKIETSFCFGESGYDFDDAVAAADRARTSENYFRWANLKELKGTIDFLSRTSKDCYGNNHAIVTASYKEGISCFYIGSLWDNWGNMVFEEVSEENRERLLEGFRKVYAAFEKRIDTYLKRYGLSKVRSWTYWRDA